MSEKEFPRYRTPFWVRVRRPLMEMLFRFIFFVLFRVRIIGKENVPKGKPYLIAYNHVSEIEPPLLLVFWPEFPEALAGHDVWERGIQGAIVKGYGAIPVKRDEYDREVMDKMLAILRGGRPLMIAPEGGRSHEQQMRPALPGVAYLVDKADVPVVPVAVVGTRDDVIRRAFSGKRDLLEIRIGKPFTLPPITEKGNARREARQRNADTVMLKIAEMLPPIYHGVYAERARQQAEESTSE